MFLRLAASVLLLIILAIPLYLLIIKVSVRRKKLLSQSSALTVGFFHPYCNAGGGGERVLWCAIRAMQFKFRDIKIVIYTGDLDASSESILLRAQQRFNITLNDPVEFVYLRRRRWVEAAMYPVFTLLGQSVGSVWLGLEALQARPPDIYIDTMGYAFTLPVFKYLGDCKTACYVHYPTVTEDMLSRLAHRQEAHNNRRTVARSPFLTGAKMLYYRVFAWLYGRVGNCADTVMVNSTWTENHINALWGCALKTHRVYPPCDVDELKQLSGQDRAQDVFKIVSVGQFRPEKDHPMQLRSMYQLRQILPEELWAKIHLVFVGSCRGAEDTARVKDMQDLAKHLSLEDNVHFRVNVTYAELKTELSQATAGLHAMWNEHFGIGVVECMAAGLLMVAHDSGGPKADIVEQAAGSRNGYLAADESEYARALATIILMSLRERDKIRQCARSSVDRFSTQEFEKGFLRAIEPFFRSPK